MIPILYEASETAFTSNGLGRLRDAISAEVVEERNGVFELNLQYPHGGAHYDEIVPGRIIFATHDDTGVGEPFDIVSVNRTIAGEIDVHAVHVSYRQTGITASGNNVNSLSDAFTMLSNGVPSNPFTYSTDITTGAYMASADGTPRSVRQFLGGVEGSILDTYGGEYTFSMFNVKLERARGVARDLTIRYGVNMLDYNEETDYSETFTSCVPFWSGDVNGTTTIVKGSKVDSGAVSYNGRDVCVPLDLSDKFETKPTSAQLQAEALSQMTAKKTNLPAQTISVEFARLQDLGFDEYAGLMTCNLCDTVNVVFPFANTTGQYKIVKTTWDVLRDKYESMELGTLSSTLADALGITNALEKQIDVTQFVPTVESGNGTQNITSGTALQDLGMDETLSSGVWVVNASIRYASNATGYRAIQITVGGSGVNASLVQTPAGGTGNVDIATVAIVRSSASWHLGLNGRQNSGSTMNNVAYYWQAVKVGEYS